MRNVLKEVAITLATDIRNLLAAAIGILILVWALNLLAAVHVVATTGLRFIAPEQHEEAGK